MRDAFAIFILALQLPIPLFWLVVHPGIGFWRRHRRACYYGVGVTVWVVVALALVLPRPWWLGERFARHPGLALVGLALLAADVWLLRQVERQAGWRVLIGLPELGASQASHLVASGIYQRVRHPRYLGMMAAWWGAVFLSGATRLLLLVAGFTVLAVLVTELEERELLERLGPRYADYRQRVPRFFPRLRWVGRG